MPRGSPRPRFAWIAMALGTIVVALGCGSKKPAAPPAAPPITLHLEPACDLAPAAALSWIVEAKPRTVAEIPDLIPAIALVLSEERLGTFAKAHGGIDLRQIQDLCVAGYKSATLSIARVPVDPDKVAAAFETRATSSVTRALLAQNPRVVRLSAEVDSQPEQLAIFGRESVAQERGKPGPGVSGPLRVAEAFAFGKLKKAAPALSGAALKRAAEVLGSAPVRAFAPGPFEGETANGLGGLMRAATAVGASAKSAGSSSNIAVRIVLTGAWGADVPAAAERLGAAAHLLAESPIGHLFGLHRPVQEPSVHVEPDALVLDAVIDGAALARGIHDALDAEVAEIMRK